MLCKMKISHYLVLSLFAVVLSFCFSVFGLSSDSFALDEPLISNWHSSYKYICGEDSGLSCEDFLSRGYSHFLLVVSPVANSGSFYHDFTIHFRYKTKDSSFYDYRYDLNRSFTSCSQNVSPGCLEKEYFVFPVFNTIASPLNLWSFILLLILMVFLLMFMD